MPTRYAQNLISKLPIRGLSYFPTQKSNPKDPWVCLSTYSPKNDFPIVPLTYKNVLTSSAIILTVDKSGQN